MSPILRTRGLQAGYGKITVVRDLDFEISAGEIVAMLGRNGAGKTTSLLTFAGALKPIGGEVECLGTHTSAALSARARKGLGLMTDDRSVFFGLTVKENLRLARGTREVLDLFPELKAHMNKPAGLLSGGEQQMLGLAAVLSREPQLLLIDELSFGLAPRIVQRLMITLREVADQGTAIVLVEQFARLVLDVADRAYVLNNGRVVAHDTTANLRGDVSALERAILGATEAA